jgi:23S rRNA pseudouridine1911/1915/1917 synthase
MVVHPGAGNLHHTLVNALVFRYGRDFESGDPASSKNADSAADIDEDEAWQLDPLRPGIVHRLDKDTSGTMVIALNRESHRKLAAQFKEHTVSKVYIAICKGFFTNKRGRIQTNLVRDRKDRKKFTICQPPKGKSADTSFVVLRQFEGYALVRISIHTGRTHQIRVHMASIGHPLLGDPIYARPDRTFPQATLMLHSFSLELDHPRDGRRLNFRSPMPQRFKQIIRQL